MNWSWHDFSLIFFGHVFGFIMWAVTHRLRHQLRKIELAPGVTIRAGNIKAVRVNGDYAEVVCHAGIYRLKSANEGAVEIAQRITDAVEEIY